MLNLFISYCHANKPYEREARRTLQPLVDEQRIRINSDQDLLAGQRIRKKNDERIRQSDIIVFLLTREFIASPECQREWDLAKEEKEPGFERRRIPLLIGYCPWPDLLKDEDLLIIPNNATPLQSYDNTDEGWLEIYSKIKSVVSSIETNLTIRPEFHQFLEQTDIIGEYEVTLSSSYVFGRVRSYDRTDPAEIGSLEGSIINIEKILERNKVIIHGEPISGKTALSKMLCIKQLERDRPFIYIDAKKQNNRWNLKEIQRLFHDQFFGSWEQWLRQPNNLVVIDDLMENKDAIKFIENCNFKQVIITMDTDVYRTYYYTDQRVCSYTEMQLREISRWHQEQMIRNTLEQTTKREISDGEIDIIERKLNEIVDTRIIPRYPFYVLSFIQAIQVFMPQDASITSHAHCYYIFILGRLLKAGIEKEDGPINACLNFAEYLAKAVYDRREKDDPINLTWFHNFIESYKKKYIISDEQVRRMCDPRYGILDGSGGFRIRYMEFYFLGRFLARNSTEGESILRKMCGRSEIERYHLTLLFVIHHADNHEILENITLNTMCSLERISPAVLDQDETNRFQNLIASLKRDILTNRSVEEERQKSRDDSDHEDHEDFSEDPSSEYEADEILKVLKNNRILGQVLRTRHGNIERRALKEIIEAIADGGLRVVNAILSSTDEIEASAQWIKAKYPRFDSEKIRKELISLSFLWTMNNIEMIVDAVNKEEVRPILKEIVHEKDTPAYDLIYYFSELDNANQLNDKILSELMNLWKYRRDFFIRRVASIRTQFYMNTHNSERKINQKFCDFMQIKYVYRRIKQ